jgi:hypothetical protein
MCELLHTGDVFWPSSGDPPPRGTDGSNPSPSRGESTNHRFRRYGPYAENGLRYKEVGPEEIAPEFLAVAEAWAEVETV